MIKWLDSGFDIAVLDTFAFLSYLLAFRVDLLLGLTLCRLPYGWGYSLMEKNEFLSIVSCKAGQAAGFEKLFSSHLWCVRWQTVLGSLGRQFDRWCARGDLQGLTVEEFSRDLVQHSQFMGHFWVCGCQLRSPSPRGESWDFTRIPWSVWVQD